MSDFYDGLAPFFHLIYNDWEQSIENQAECLEKIIHSRWSGRADSVLDVSCGIGTQAIGLARLGFTVTACDLSRGVVERAIQETAARDLSIRYAVCDMREAHRRHGTGFDVVISCDNSITHLLSDAEILRALKEMRYCLRAGGGCLLSVRDYDKEERGKGIVKPYGTRRAEGKRYLIFQIWDFDGEQYDLSMYFVEDDGTSDVLRAHVRRSRYYAIGTDKLLGLMRQAGFVDVERRDGCFFQPVLVGTNPG